MNNLIYASKYKLVGIDGILPLLMETKAKIPNVNIIVLFPDAKHMREIRRNYHIWQALEEIGAEFYVMRDGYKSFWNIAKFLWRVSLNKNTLIKNADVLPKHKWFMHILTLISKTTEIKAFTANNTLESYTLSKIYDDFYHNINNVQVMEKREYYDYYISTCSRDILKSACNINVPKSKFQKLGYLRKLPEWTGFMNREKDKLPYSDRKYFVIYLSGTAPETMLGIENYYLTLLYDILTTLKKYNSDILTVFKPHIVSDMEYFKTFLKQTGYQNYIIDYAHPMIMACNAQFVLAYMYSMTLFDACTFWAYPSSFILNIHQAFWKRWEDSHMAAKHVTILSIKTL